jgi:hypothetical protein
MLISLALWHVACLYKTMALVDLRRSPIVFRQ